LNTQKAAIKNCPNPVIIVNNCYKIRVQDEAPSTDVTDYLSWDKLTLATSPLGNQIQCYENCEQLSCWYEPIVSKIVKFDVESELPQTIADTENVKLKKRWLYRADDKANMKMVHDLVKNNLARCNFYVVDERTGFTRVVSYEDWKSKPMDTLLAMDKSALEKQQLQQQTQYH
jgi:hypothetical protein